MILRECQIFKLRFFAQIALCGLLALLISCGGSKDKHLARGEEYLQKRKFQEAVIEFRAAADIDKDSAAANPGLARAFENLEQFNEALEELRKTADLAPENLEAKTKLGNSFGERYVQGIFWIRRYAVHINARPAFYRLHAEL